MEHVDQTLGSASIHDVGHIQATLTDDLRHAIARRRFICTYFAQLQLEYEALCPVEFQAANAARVAELRVHHLARPTWTNNHRFELLLMQGIEPAILEQRLMIYRDRLKTLVGSERACALSDAFAATPGATVETQRVVALGLLAEIQRLRHVRSEFERLRNRLLMSLLLAGALFGGATWYLLTTTWLPPVVHVFAAGLLGGYFSVLLKLGALQFCVDYNANYHQVDRLFWNVLCSLALSMFEGAVGALILVTMFMSGLLKGSLFPNYENIELANVDLSQLFWMIPTGSAEAAKLIVWCALAGFSERLIPDFLSNLAQRAELRASQPAVNAEAAQRQPAG
jgi:hypothetical protein